MNKHFHDSLYYLRRAGEHARLGLETELEPVTTRARELLGHESEPEPDRLEGVRDELADLERAADRQVRATLANAHRTVSEARSDEATLER